MSASTRALPLSTPESPPSRLAIPSLATAWMVACRSEDLGQALPIARVLNGIPVALFRAADGRASALEDRCPHKNVALSLGRVMHGTLECRYHGWKLAPDGAVVDVPCHAPDERLPTCKAPAFEVRERDGWIWCSLGRSSEEPPRWERHEGYGWFELDYMVNAPMDLVLENGLDCSHTGFAHEGLFRSAPTQFATVNLEETPTGVRIETVEEEARRRWDVRRALGGRREIRHVDEIVLPHTLRVDYRIGTGVHVITIMVCTPETPERTRVHNRMGVRHGALTPLVTRYVKWLTRKVVAQDVAVLESQAERIRQFGERSFRGVTADLPAAWYQRAGRRATRGAADRPLEHRRIEYRL